MRWRGQLAWMVLLAVLGTAAVVADDSMRCGRYIANIGDSQSRVLELCGEPRRAWQDGFIEETARRGDRYYDPVNPVPLPYPRQSGYETEVRRIIPVYRWEYSLGPGTFLKTLVFHGDILVGIVQGPRQ